MGTLFIKQSQLPEIIDSMKTMVNNGYWYLYEISEYKNSFYMLKASGIFYFLAKNGKVNFITDSLPEEVDIKENLFFADVPSPPTVSNFKMAYT